MKINNADESNIDLLELKKAINNHLRSNIDSKVYSKLDINIWCD